MKKFLAIILAILMIFSFVACNKSSDKENDATDAHKHSFSEEWEKDATHHWHVCSDDKCDETDDKAEHVWDNGKITTEPTKEKDGVTTFTCSICGQTKTEVAKYAEKLPATEDEILAYVLAAIDETQKYKGSMSMSTASDMILSQKQGEEKDEQSNKTSSFMSFDADNKIAYYEASNESNDNKSVNYTKTFLDNGAFYGYQKEVQTGNTSKTDEQYFKIEDSVKDEYQTVDFEEYLGEIFDIYKGIKLAENIAEIRSAYQTTLPVLLLDIYNDKTLKPDITSNVTATVENGVCDFVIDIISSASKTEDGIKTDRTVNFYIKASAKDNKLVYFNMKVEMTSKMTQGETVMLDAVQKVDTTIDIEYSFATDKYNSLAVTLPTNPDDIEIKKAETIDSYDDIKMSIVVNGKENNTVWFNGVTTPQEAFDMIVSHSNLSHNPVTIKVFKDEALTQELTKETITEQDVFSMEKVYLSATPDATHALIYTTRTSRENYSKPFQITIPTISIFGRSSSEKSEMSSCREAGEYTLDAAIVNDPSYEIIVNGVKMETKTATITLEGGKCYNIEYIKLISDPVIGENE